MNSWDNRTTRYEDTHHIQQEEFDALVKSLNLKDGMVVADLMCGYGAVSREILRYCSTAGIDIELLLVDSSKRQLERSHAELAGGKVSRVSGDILDLSLLEMSLDVAVIKMGLHEVTKKDQQMVVARTYQTLVSKGCFVLWDVLHQYYDTQCVFSNIIRVKDELSGLASLAKDRYFFTQQELSNYLVTSGFNDIQPVWNGAFLFDSQSWLNSDFKEDADKLNVWNDYIRANTPRYIRSELNYVDLDKTIKMEFTQGIIKAIK